MRTIPRSFTDRKICGNDFCCFHLLSLFFAYNFLHNFFPIMSIIARDTFTYAIISKCITTLWQVKEEKLFYYAIFPYLYYKLFHRLELFLNVLSNHKIFSQKLEKHISIWSYTHYNVPAQWLKWESLYLFPEYLKLISKIQFSIQKPCQWQIWTRDVNYYFERHL